MPTIETIGIEDLKNNLSAYLREVRLGTRILVSDPNRVTVELRRPRVTDATPETDDPILSEWITSGVVIAPTRRKGRLPESPVRLEEGAAACALEWDRGPSRPFRT